MYYTSRAFFYNGLEKRFVQIRGSDSSNSGAQLEFTSRADMPASRVRFTLARRFQLTISVRRALLTCQPQNDVSVALQEVIPYGESQSGFLTRQACARTLDSDSTMANRVAKTRRRQVRWWAWHARHTHQRKFGFGDWTGGPRGGRAEPIRVTVVAEAGGGLTSHCGLAPRRGPHVAAPPNA